MSVSNGQLANAATFNGAFVSKSSDSTISATLTQDKESVLKEIATPTTPASGYGKIYFKADGKLYQLNDAGIETEVGTGGGGAGGVNFISNGNAEDNVTTGWATYADTAGTSPVDGTGGTANVTITSSATSPLAGTFSFILTKDAVNRQGQGWSYDFSIDATYKAKVLQISFDYLVNSGTFVAGTSSADSDVTVWIYDVTNSQVIQGSSYKLLSNSTSLTDTFRATFQSASNSTSYRLIFHVGSTSASAYTLKVDNVSVSPSVYAYGTPVTDWQSYTPTFTGFGTVSTQTFWWRRNGDTIQIKGRFAAGTSTATEARISLPFSLVSDSAKVNGTAEMCGVAQPSDVNSSTTGGIGATFNVLIEPSLNYVTFGTRASTIGGLTKINANQIATGGTSLSLFAQLPIQGWSSSVQTSDQTDTRIVSMSGYVGSGQSLTANVTNVAVTATKDSHSAWTGSTYVVPVAGDYVFSGNLGLLTSQSPTVYKNGVYTGLALGYANASGTQAGGSVLVPNCVAGDILSLRSTSSGTVNAAVICIYRLSGPSTVAANETVAASYWVTTNTSTTAGNPFNFDAKEYDTHSAVTTGATTWKFTAPIGGVYTLMTMMNPATNPAASYYLNVWKNGALFGSAGWGTTTSAQSGVLTFRLNAGDYVDLRATQNFQTSGNLTRATTGICTIQIHRIGN